ncbi:hypothetical protein HDU81_005022 [Chytriomyces hyalinus]|nr:hypothetical protein HDU81_005022 [Chytriomyces hyalinus]
MEQNTLVQQLVDLRLANPSLTIKSAHELFLSQGQELSLSAVKKAFSKSTKALESSRQAAAEQAHQTLEAKRLEAGLDTDLDALWTQALSNHSQQKTQDAINYAASLLLRFPESSAKFEKDVKSKNAAPASLLQTATNIADSESASPMKCHAYIVVAGLHLLGGRFEEALKAVRSAQENLEAVIASHGGDSAPLDEVAVDGINLKRRKAELFSLSGTILLHSNRIEGLFKECLQDLDKSIELYPDCARTRQMRAVASFKGLRFDGAITDANWMKGFEAENGDCKYSVGPYLAAAVACLTMGKVEEGKQWYAVGCERMKKYKTEGPEPKLAMMASEAMRIFRQYDRASGLTPLVNGSGLTPRVLLSNIFVRSAVQNHLRLSFAVPALADSMLGLRAAQTLSVQTVTPSMLFSVDSNELIETRTLSVITRPNDSDTNSRMKRLAYTDADVQSFWNDHSRVHRSLPFKHNKHGKVLGEQSSDIDALFSASDFHRVGSVDVPIADTVSVSQCSDCAAMGYTPCRSCSSSGKVVCSKCDGSGVMEAANISTTDDNNDVVVKQITRVTTIKNTGESIIEQHEETVSRNSKKSDTANKKLSPCSGCKSTGKNQCSKCNGSGKRKCATCQGHASTITYLNLNISRECETKTKTVVKSTAFGSGLFSPTTSPHFNPPSYDDAFHESLPSLAHFQTVTAEAHPEILAASRSSNLPSRVIWDAFEEQDNNNGSTSAVPSRRMPVPQVHVPESLSPAITAAILALDLSDVIDLAVPVRIAPGETRALSPTIIRSSLVVAGGRLILDTKTKETTTKVIARRNRIRQARVFSVRVEYPRSAYVTFNTPDWISALFSSSSIRENEVARAATPTTGSFTAIFADIGLNQLDTVETIEHNSLVLVHVDGYPMDTLYWNMGLGVLGSIAFAAAAAGLFALARANAG